MATQTVLLRIDADASSLIASTEQSKKALQGLGTTTNQTASGTTKATYGFERLGTQLTRLPRTSVFPMLNSQLISLSSSMTGATNAGAGLQQGMMVLQGAGGSLLGPIGLLVGALAGLGIALLANKLNTVNASKEFNEYRKKLEETKKAAENLKKVHEAVAKGQVNFATTLKMTLINLVSHSKAVEIWRKELEKVKKELESYDSTLTGSLALSQAEYKLVTGQTIPALKMKTIALQESIEKLKEENKDWEINKKVLDEITSQTKDLTEAKKQLNDASAKQILQQKILAFQPQTVLGEPKGNQLKLVKAQLEPVNKYITQMERDWQDESQRSANAIANFAGTIGDAFANMMMGVEVRWGEMLQNMLKQMMASAIMNILTSILSGIPGAGSALKFMGFQHGTPYVPETGMYMLHRGEAVVPAHRNISYVRQYNSGQNTTNYYLLNLDPDKLTRRSIIPAIEKMIQNRQTRLVMS